MQCPQLQCTLTSSGLRRLHLVPDARLPSQLAWSCSLDQLLRHEGPGKHVCKFCCHPGKLSFTQCLKLMLAWARMTLCMTQWLHTCCSTSLILMADSTSVQRRLPAQPQRLLQAVQWELRRPRGA